MRLLGKELITLKNMYGCDCCAIWKVAGEAAVLLVHEDKTGKWHFSYECLDCEGVGVCLIPIVNN